MTGHLDFAMPGALLAALGIGVLQPLYLFMITRMPMMAERNAIQFLISCVVTLLLWVLVLLLVPGLRRSSVAELALSLMALGAGMLVYLELWGLMSRGYTLGVILTLQNAGNPLSEAAISRSYRDGEGLEWIMRHRVGGLAAAGLIESRNEQIMLTVRGRAVARLYRISIFALGMRRTG
jgi:hypothetical protein